MGTGGQTASELDIRLENMRRDFLMRLAEKGNQMHEVLIEIREHGPSAELRETIARNAHQTSGVAPTHGYTELAATARQVEAVWSKDFSPETLDHAKSVTDEYLAMLEAVLLT